MTSMILTSKLTNLFSGVKAHSIAGPLLILMILGMMVLPLPAFLLDMMFTFNIALSIMVLLVSIHTLKPLDFAVFPTVLLLSTLLRLSLNVASTRIVLMEGHKGPDAAGKVEEPPPEPPPPKSPPPGTQPPASLAPSDAQSTLLSMWRPGSGTSCESSSRSPATINQPS